MVDVVCGPLLFCSTFDSGNLHAVTPCEPSQQEQPPARSTGGNRDCLRCSTTSPPTEFNLHVAPDCSGTSHENQHRSWFFFSVTFVGPPRLPESASASESGTSALSAAAPPSQSVRRAQRGTDRASAAAATSSSFKATFRVVNFSASNRIFDHDNRPVFRCEGAAAWKRLPQPLCVTYFDRHGNEMSPPPPPATMASEQAASAAAAMGSGTTAAVGSGGVGTSLGSNAFFSAAGSASNFAAMSRQRVAGSVPMATSGAARVLVAPTAKAIARGTMRISWSYTFIQQEETVWFAMCYPYSYSTCLAAVDRWQAAHGWELQHDDVKSQQLDGVLGGVAHDDAVLPRAPSVDVEGDAQKSAPKDEVGILRVASGSGGNTTASLASSRTPAPPPPKHSKAAPVGAGNSAPGAGLMRRAQQRQQRQQHTAAASLPSTPLRSPVSPLSPHARTPTKVSGTRGTSESAGASEAQARKAYKSPPIYFHRETLCYSIENRRVELLTITGLDGASPALEREPYCSGTVPVRSNGVDRPLLFPEKPLILLTARVHPGEVPGSHVLHGIIDFLLNIDDPRAAALRSRFVFKVVPMLNPDGVAMGHYRTDSRGVNLNRVYGDPDLALHPTIHATRTLFRALAATGRLAVYVDFHAHASRRGCFVFGNAWDDIPTTIENLLLPKLISLNTAHFAFSSCDFTSRSMATKNRTDGFTKEGTGRVALAMESGLVHSYTLEVSYNTSWSVNPIVALDNHPSLGAPAGQGASTVACSRGTKPTTQGGWGGAGGEAKYSPATYHEIGRGIAVSLLDLYGWNPISRLPHTSFQSTAGVRQSLERQLRQLHLECSEACSSNNSSNTRGSGAASVVVGGVTHRRESGGRQRGTGKRQPPHVSVAGLALPSMTLFPSSTSTPTESGNGRGGGGVGAVVNPEHRKGGVALSVQQFSRVAAGRAESNMAGNGE